MRYDTYHYDTNLSYMSYVDVFNAKQKKLWQNCIATTIQPAVISGEVFFNMNIIPQQYKNYEDKYIMLITSHL